MTTIIVAFTVFCLTMMFLAVIRNPRLNKDKKTIAGGMVILLLVVFDGFVLYLATNETTSDACVTNWQGFEIKVDQSAGKATIERKEIGNGKLEFCSGGNVNIVFYQTGQRVTFSEDYWRDKKLVPNIYLSNSKAIEGVGWEVLARGELIIDKETCEVQPIDCKICSELWMDMLEAQKKVDEQSLQGKEE